MLKYQQNMRKLWLLLLVTFYVCKCVCSEWSPEQICEKTVSGSQTHKASVTSGKNESSEWEDVFAALTEFRRSSDGLDVELTRSVFECNNKRYIIIQGVSNALNPTTANRRLHFHARHGENAAILDNGRSAEKINNDDAFNTQIFTNRPLKNDEIFEVELDKKNTKFSWCLVAIGVTTRSPDTVPITSTMYKSPFVWIYQDTHIFSNDTIQVQGYGTNINNLEVGDKVAVKWNKMGTLHFYVNGEDQGHVAFNVTSPVYGLVELWYNAMKVSIVD